MQALNPECNNSHKANVACRVIPEILAKSKRTQFCIPDAVSLSQTHTKLLFSCKVVLWWFPCIYVRRPSSSSQNVQRRLLSLSNVCSSPPPPFHSSLRYQQQQTSFRQTAQLGVTEKETAALQADNEKAMHNPLTSESESTKAQRLSATHIDGRTNQRWRRAGKKQVVFIDSRRSFVVNLRKRECCCCIIRGVDSKVILLRSVKLAPEGVIRGVYGLRSHQESTIFCHVSLQTFVEIIIINLRSFLSVCEEKSSAKNCSVVPK